ncbi:MAG: Holliday junction resolvase RuvX [Flammeovirgaceae bacterium]
MGRILSIDYGTKRTGLAVTDPLRIIATALETVESAKLIEFLKKYFEREVVDEVVIGMPKQMNNQESDTAGAVRQFIEKFKKAFPEKPIDTYDERFTTSIAQQAMIMGGMKKKDRQVKGQTDRISAVLILQDYMSIKRK